MIKLQYLFQLAKYLEHEAHLKITNLNNIQMLLIAKLNKII